MTKFKVVWCAVAIFVAQSAYCLKIDESKSSRVKPETNYERLLTVFPIGIDALLQKNNMTKDDINTATSFMLMKEVRTVVFSKGEDRFQIESNNNGILELVKKQALIYSAAADAVKQ